MMSILSVILRKEYLIEEMVPKEFVLIQIFQ